MATMEPTGRVKQQDYNKTVMGWVDANGIAYRNDYNRMKVGHVDLQARMIYEANYAKTLVGRVDENGFIYACSTVVHESLTNVAIGRVEGPKEGQMFAACAFFLL